MTGKGPAIIPVEDSMPMLAVWTTGKPTLLRSTPVVLSLVITIASTRSLFAQADESTQLQETTARRFATNVEVLTPAVSLPQLPVGFLKAVPESIDDLQEMETHVQSLVPHLTDTTVALTVGNAQGSGVIVSDDGYVLTAAHVSGPPNRPVAITLADGTRAVGRSLGRNRTLDSSLIKIESPQRKWPFAAMAKLEDIGIGDWSVVLGHPGGHQAGRPPVFRLGRVIHVDQQVIQTDNELVGGDSGRPLFDMHGRVIGINSRIGPSTSFNLHTPISAYTNDWQRMVDSEDFILHSGALLGVTAEPSGQGLKLTRVWPDEPAGRAGLREGDILLRFESRRVRSLDRLIELVGEHQPGQRVALQVLRDDEEIRITVELGARKQSSE